VLCLTSHFFKSPNWRAVCNHIWYQIGLLEARHPGRVVPYQFKNVPVPDLSKTPLQRPHAISNMKALEEIFKGDFRSTMAKCDFYKEDTLNRTVRNRLGYTKLEVALKIEKSLFEDTLANYNSNFKTKHDKESFLRLLRDNLSCGARLISFGAESQLTTHLLPYAEEIHTVTNIDYPVNFSCKHVFKPEKEDAEKTDLLGEYWLEIVLPVHRLLGVNFKCFIAGNKDLPIGCLEMLFGPNFAKENDKVMVEDEDKLYFSLDFPEDESFQPPAQLGIGKKADYMFPQ